jgi:hypothetical protein
MALLREREHINGWEFFKLVLSSFASRVVSRNTNNQRAIDSVGILAAQISPAGAREIVEASPGDLMELACFWTLFGPYAPGRREPRANGPTWQIS